MLLLLTEYDTAVRDLLQYALRLEGHQVISVATWFDMLTALRSGEPYNAVVTEIILPQDRNHAEAITEARQRGIPVLLMTGDTGTMIELDRQRISYLEKPFQIERLLAWVREQEVPTAASDQDSSVS